MHKTLAEIAHIIQGEIAGNERLVIKGISGIKEAREGDLTFVANSKYFALVSSTKASVVIAPRGQSFDAAGKTFIYVDNPSLAFSQVIASLHDHKSNRIEGVHPTAVIASSATIGSNVGIGPYVTIAEGACIGSGTMIHDHCSLGIDAVVGSDCCLFPHVSVRERVKIHDRVIIHAGAVIGADGFGFVKVDGKHQKIPQVGIVEIHDDVEIGANVTIDRARFDKTVIGQGTKIDNLVHVAHNVKIGENCLIIAQVGISGSTVIEDNCILAGQAGLAGHLTIGKNSIVASQGGVTSSVPPNTVVSGYPAKPHDKAKRVNACVQRLPHYVKIINELKSRIQALEERLKLLNG